MTAKPTLVLVGPAVAGLLLSLLTVLPAPVRAQSCAMLPPGTPPEGPQAPEEAQQEAVETVSGALTDAEVTVIPSADAQRRMVGEPFAECNELDCGSNVVRSLGVDFVVLVTVWAPEGTPTIVVVTLIGPSDSVAGDAPVEGGDVSAAALSALTTARQRWQASQMGFIEVSSEPPGADVEVDGRVVGQTPIRKLVPAGERRIRVLLEGYETVERTLQITPTREHPLDVTLEEAAPEPAPQPVTRTEPHWANWLIGGGLVAVGVGLMAPAIGTGIGDAADLCSQSVEGMPDLCRRTYHFGEVSGVLLGVGAAAAVAGVVFLIAQPLQLTTVVTPDSAMLELRGTF